MCVNVSFTFYSLAKFFFFDESFYTEKGNYEKGLISVFRFEVNARGKTPMGERGGEGRKERMPRRGVKHRRKLELKTAEPFACSPARPTGMTGKLDNNFFKEKKVCFLKMNNSSHVNKDFPFSVHKI